jgi:hypothetical protein
MRLAQNLREVSGGRTNNATEGTVVIDLEQYRRAKRSRAASVAAQRCEEERMCVNWTPSRGMAALFCYRDPRLMSPQLPDDFAGLDVEDFIDRLYALASQV